MADITRLLARWAGGDPQAFAVLMPVVYEEMKKLAEHYLRQERPDHTLQPTALVHEAYLRLAGIRAMELKNRTHFYGAAAQVMRRVLVDYARQRRARKRGGPSLALVPFEEAMDTPVDTGVDLVALDEALAALEVIAPGRARVVELRFFGGLSVEETAEYLGIAPATVKRHWVFARAWLFDRLAGPDERAADRAPGAA
jgi:RNA polymerase sigma factor (TIGR02999 family)